VPEFFGESLNKPSLNVAAIFLAPVLAVFHINNQPSGGMLFK
jgi:hypothetical protein